MKVEEKLELHVGLGHKK